MRANHNNVTLTYYSGAIRIDGIRRYLCALTLNVVDGLDVVTCPV